MKTPPNGGVVFPAVLGRGSVVALLGRLREALTQLAELVDLFACQLGVPVGHVRHRLVEPLGLVLWLRTDHAAPHDMLEQFIASFLEW